MKRCIKNDTEMSRFLSTATFSKEEVWSVCQELRPDISREEYEKMWDEFMRRKLNGEFETQ